jgi:cytochrome c oxidase cbb3-type subunit 4
MDVNDLRSAVTVIGLVLFLGLVASVYSKRRLKDFDAAAKLPFDGEEEGRQ